MTVRLPMPLLSVALLLSVASPAFAPRPATAEPIEPLDRPDRLQALEVRAAACVAEHGPEVHGALVVRLEVQRNGRPLDARMDSRDFDAPGLEGCLLAAAAEEGLTGHPPSPRHLDFLRFTLDPSRRPPRVERISTLRGRAAGLVVSIPDVVESVLAEQGEALDACNPKLGPDPDRADAVSARFLVDGRGSVMWARVEGPPARRAEAACIEGLLLALRVPPPRPYRFAEVRYSLLLPPDGGVRPTAFGPTVDLRHLPGALSRSAVGRIVDPEVGAMRTCYARARELDPDLGGRLRVDFLVETHGGAEFVRVSRAEGALGAPEAEALLTECVQAVFDALEFPQPRYGGVVRVRYPLLFEPSVSTVRGPAR